MADAHERTSPVRSTAVAVFCFLGCLCGYFVLLFVPLDDNLVDDFEIKARHFAQDPLFYAFPLPLLGELKPQLAGNCWTRQQRTWRRWCSRSGWSPSCACSTDGSSRRATWPSTGARADCSQYPLGLQL